jgi:hypothetical protein
MRKTQVTRVFDFSRTYLLFFFILGFTLIMTDGLQEITWNAVGASFGGAAGLIVFFGCFDWLARHFSLRAFNVFIVGSLLGYLFSWTFISCLNHIIQWTPALIP